MRCVGVLEDHSKHICNRFLDKIVQIFKEMSSDHENIGHTHGHNFRKLASIIFPIQRVSLDRIDLMMPLILFAEHLSHFYESLDICHLHTGAPHHGLSNMWMAQTCLTLWCSH